MTFLIVGLVALALLAVFGRAPALGRESGRLLRRLLRRPEPETMSRADAAAMLGVAESASRAEVEAAFRRLMPRVHPDQGGAAGLAAQVSAARATLLAKR